MMSDCRKRTRSISEVLEVNNTVVVCVSLDVSNEWKNKRCQHPPSDKAIRALLSSSDGFKVLHSTSMIFFNI